MAKVYKLSVHISGGRCTGKTILMEKIKALCIKEGSCVEVIRSGESEEIAVYSSPDPQPYKTVDRSYNDPVAILGSDEMIPTGFTA